MTAEPAPAAARGAVNGAQWGLVRGHGRRTSSGATTERGVPNLKLPEFMTARISNSFLVKSQDPRRLPSCGSHPRPSEPPADPRVSFSGPGCIRGRFRAAAQTTSPTAKPLLVSGADTLHCGCAQMRQHLPTNPRRSGTEFHIPAASAEGLPPGAPVWLPGGFRQSPESRSDGVQASITAFAPQTEEGSTRAGTDHKHRDPRTSGDPMISKDLMSFLNFFF